MSACDVRLYLQEIDMLEQALLTAARHLDNLSRDHPTIFIDHANKSMKWYKQIATGIAQIKEKAFQISENPNKTSGQIPLPVLSSSGFVSKNGPESWEKISTIEDNHKQ